MKTLVTHLGPDLDAITSSWLIKRNLPGWNEAEIQFVPAGSTLDGIKPDENPDIIHVDTGLGKFDHHQFQAKLSASKIVYDYLKENHYLKNYDIEGLDRLINFVNEIDNVQEVFFPDPSADVYDFALHQTLEGMRNQVESDQKLVEIGFTILDGVLQTLKNKVKAEREIAKGMILQTKWGKSLALETKSEEATKLALKLGYHLVIRKDPEKQFVRVKTYPQDDLDLTPLYEKLKAVDPNSTWFLHSSKHMLLNGSSKNPNAIPSKLTLAQVIAIIKEM